MRLIRFRSGDRIAHGALDDGIVRVLQGTFFEDPLPTGEEVALDDVRLLAPVLPSKVVAVARNYAAHAAEFGGEVPEEPMVFLKPSTAVIGPGDRIPLPPISRRVDFEGELVVVMGRLARNVPVEEAGKYVLGYTCGNDVTLRDLQKRDGQWTRAKGFDGSCPLGPWIETLLDPGDNALTPSPHYDEYTRDEFFPMDPIEMLDELRRMVEALDMSGNICFDHFMNAPIFRQDWDGYQLPEEKEHLLSLMDETLESLGRGRWGESKAKVGVDPDMSDSGGCRE